METVNNQSGKGTEMEVEILFYGDGYTVCDLEGWSYGEFSTYAEAAEYAHDRGWNVVLF